MACILNILHVQATDTALLLFLSLLPLDQSLPRLHRAKRRKLRELSSRERRHRSRALSLNLYLEQTIPAKVSEHLCDCVFSLKHPLTVTTRESPPSPNPGLSLWSQRLCSSHENRLRPPTREKVALCCGLNRHVCSASIATRSRLGTHGLLRFTNSRTVTISSTALQPNVIHPSPSSKLTPTSRATSRGMDLMSCLVSRVRSRSIDIQTQGGTLGQLKAPRCSTSRLRQWTCLFRTQLALDAEMASAKSIVRALKWGWALAITCSEPRLPPTCSSKSNESLAFAPTTKQTSKASARPT